MLADKLISRTKKHLRFYLTAQQLNSCSSAAATRQGSASENIVFRTSEQIFATRKLTHRRCARRVRAVNSLNQSRSRSDAKWEALVKIIKDAVSSMKLYMGSERSRPRSDEVEKRGVLLAYAVATRQGSDKGMRSYHPHVSELAVSPFSRFIPIYTVQ
jgi:hypothetical protein